MTLKSIFSCFTITKMEELSANECMNEYFGHYQHRWVRFIERERKKKLHKFFKIMFDFLFECLFRFISEVLNAYKCCVQRTVSMSTK